MIGMTDSEDLPEPNNGDIKVVDGKTYVYHEGIAAHWEEQTQPNTEPGEFEEGSCGKLGQLLRHQLLPHQREPVAADVKQIAREAWAHLFESAPDRAPNDDVAIIVHAIQSATSALQRENAELKQQLADHAEDWAFCGIPHGSQLAQLLVKSDQCHKLQARLATSEAALRWITVVNAMDYEYRKVAKDYFVSKNP